MISFWGLEIKKARPLLRLVNHKGPQSQSNAVTRLSVFK
nr:MAG TPA: hypothetical protein [Siphoviridae sp. ctDlU28]